MNGGGAAAAAATTTRRAPPPPMAPRLPPRPADAVDAVAPRAADAAAARQRRSDAAAELKAIALPPAPAPAAPEARTAALTLRASARLAAAAFRRSRAGHPPAGGGSLRGSSLSIRPSTPARITSVAYSDERTIELVRQRLEHRRADMQPPRRRARAIRTRRAKGAASVGEIVRRVRCGRGRAHGRRRAGTPEAARGRRGGRRHRRRNGGLLSGCGWEEARAAAALDARSRRNASPTERLDGGGGARRA